MSHAVVLTYHRVPDAKLAKTKFHDLPFDRFRKQMEMVAARSRSSATGPSVCITLDDGTCDHMAAGDLLNELGLKGTFFIITERLGRKNCLTHDQVTQLARQGHRIGSHTVSHCHLTKLNRAELDEELIKSKQILEDLTGNTIDWLALPGGMYNPFVLNRAFALGYSVFRTMDWGYADWPLRGQTPCFPILAINHPAFFQRILDGNAPVWPYMIKTYIKKVIGEIMYNRLRNQFSGLGK